MDMDMDMGDIEMVDMDMDMVDLGMLDMVKVQSSVSDICTVYLV